MMFYISRFSFYSLFASTTLSKVGGTSVNPTTLSFIENSLANLSISDSIYSVTIYSLFQLSHKKRIGPATKRHAKTTLAIIKA